METIIQQLTTLALVRAPAPTPLATLYRVWRRVSPGERMRFLLEMLTPTERRILALGMDEEGPAE